MLINGVDFGEVDERILADDARRRAPGSESQAGDLAPSGHLVAVAGDPLPLPVDAVPAQSHRHTGWIASVLLGTLSGVALGMILGRRMARENPF